MKGTKSSTAFERGAAADLWRNTLSQISSVFGRLAFLASLRNPNSGRYEHHGLALVFGKEEANQALKSSHSETFAEWLALNLSQQKSDLELYLSGLKEDRRTVLKAWEKLSTYRHVLPASVKGPERRLYLADLNALIEVLRNSADGRPSGRGA